MPTKREIAAMLGSAVFVIVVLGLLEAARRRGLPDPVSTIANLLSPPAAGGGAA